MPKEYEYRCGVCGRSYWLTDMTISPPDAPCSDECRDARIALTVPERLASEVAFLLRVGRNEVTVDPEVEMLVDAWCENVAPARTER